MTKTRRKAIDYLRMGTAPEAHESTLQSMLKLAKNSHFSRGYRKSPEAHLIERILRLRSLVKQHACGVILEKEKSLIALAVADLVGAPFEGFSLPAYQPLPPGPERTPEEREESLKALVEEMQKDGTVDENGYFTEEPN